MEIEYDGTLYDVEYRTEGRHHRATRETPEEFPEVIITSVCMIGQDVEMEIDDLDEHMRDHFQQKCEEDAVQPVERDDDDY